MPKTIDVHQCFRLRLYSSEENGRIETKYPEGNEQTAFMPTRRPTRNMYERRRQRNTGRELLISDNVRYNENVREEE